MPTARPAPIMTLCAKFFPVTSAFTVADASFSAEDGTDFHTGEKSHQQSIKLPIDADDEAIAGFLLTGEFRGLAVIGQPTATADDPLGATLFLADGDEPDDEIRFQVTLTWWE